MAVLSMATSNIFAGSDTTAISIGALLYYLCRYPVCKAKLLEEIDSLSTEYQPDNIVPLATSNRMPHLQACIYEALPAPGRRHVRPTGYPF